MTPPRGPAGKHTPYHRSDGMWVYRVDTGRITAQGTRERLTVSSKNKTEATRKYRELMRRINAGNTPTPGTQGITVKRWADQWLPAHIVGLRPKVQTDYTTSVNKWIIPTIGHRRLADLTPADIRTIRDAVIKAGRNSTTAGTHTRVLRKMLRDAIDEGHPVPQRVFSKKLSVKKAPNDRTAIPVDQALRILEQIGQRDDSSRWLFGLLYGVRQGEALGLTWECVNLAAGRAVMEWQLQRLGRNPRIPDGLRTRHLEGVMWLTENKTEAGQRVLPLIPLMAASLAAHREQSEPNPWGLVWTLRGKPIREYDDRDQWKAIQEAADVAHPGGRAWYLHECRHTVITLLKRGGVTDDVIERIVGQSRLVKSYVHLDGEDARPAIEGLARSLGLEN